LAQDPKLLVISSPEVRAHQQDATGKAFGMSLDDVSKERDRLSVAVLFLKDSDKHFRF